jgi:hypothetical protein
MNLAPFVLYNVCNTSFIFKNLHALTVGDRLCGLVIRLQISRSRVRFLALPDLPRIIGSVTGSTQHREELIHGDPLR